MTDTSLRVGVRRISVSPVDGQPNGSRARCDPLDQELLHSNASCEVISPPAFFPSAQHLEVRRLSGGTTAARSKKNARRSGENPWHLVVTQRASSAILDPEPRAAWVLAFVCIPRAVKALTVAS
ncbi:hypothetical protein PF007_g30814 [Phytophthora fragariae]|uniref:Uncharacterized protein n=1 Tax=Phytophthora fragariae TaxID=53985 RepID=A0A6A3PTR4_9STRA|nr:hypothetical protein PF007_g30814 [Phytophthora fragariae]